ncbi:FdhF/YdeP family oxidoreductase [Paludisphaera mucosa]|uniref:FdhF/YdeP family oxidoreductase n=1 Tax=Paludisphaera mucosa TaxID=3030827 RepID=A0ABT6FBF7_9BACT|nr:FdhF/YdeP family oxidoreductase [Paludisphaera mucosa]MDG3004902.1 FdhF/YdeP family oxidoreductase [Paludisphaera mucosa]
MADQEGSSPVTPPSLSPPPVELSKVQVQPYHHPAAGVGAIIHSTSMALSQLGPIRSVSMALKINQIEGFDCPSCAWTEAGQDRRETFEFCENGVKAVAAEATKRRVAPEFFRKWSVADLRARNDHWLEDQGRLTHPMHLAPGADHFAPISWEDAFALLGRELKALGSPHDAVFYTSGRTSNEAAFLYQLFARLLGTNNLPDCSNMCHESTSFGLQEQIGVGKGMVTLDDFELADAIFMIGHNPGTNHPRMLTTLANASKRGCRIVAVNPLRERGLERFAHPQHPMDMLHGGTAIAEMFLSVKIGGDVALLKGIMKEVFEAERRNPGQVIDLPFIRDHASGYDEFAAELDATSWDDVVASSGIDRETIRKAAEIYITSDRVIACWGMGVTQHRWGVANVQSIMNLLLLRGNIGRPGAGACPVRGHSNVQGDRTMGIFERPAAAFLDRLGQVFGFEPPREPGYSVVEAIKAMHEGKVGVFFAMGGNFPVASPDTDYTAEAMSRCRLTAYVATKLNRGHLTTGRESLILPCLGRTEIDEQAAGPQFVTVEDSMSIIHASHGVLKPGSPMLRSEPWIVAQLAKAALGASSTVDWDELVGDYDRIRERIAQTIPGFHDFNVRVRRPGGFMLINPAGERRFVTTTGKARFMTHPIPADARTPGRLLLATIRSHDQFNTTIYGFDDRYRGVYDARRVVFLNARDVARLGLVDRQVVDLIGEHRGESRVAPRFAVVAHDIPEGCAAAYYPETNPLIACDDVDPHSLTPSSKSVVVRIVPTTHPAESAAAV